MLLTIVTLSCIRLMAQSNVSSPMNFHIEKVFIPPILDIIPSSVQFVDANGNGVIDADEACSIRFELNNRGKGDGYGCVARVEMSGTTDGISIASVNLPVLPQLRHTQVEIPIRANRNTKTGEIQLSIVVDEPNGYGSEKLQYTIGTHKLRTPMVSVASYKIGSGAGGVLDRRQPFSLQVAIQNMDQGVAENVQMSIVLPENVNWVGGDDKVQTLASLQPNETRVYTLELMANQKAAEAIDIAVNLSEKTGLYAKDQTIPLTFGQHVGGIIEMNVARNDEEVEIQRKSLVSQVDESIPVTGAKNTNTFVVIIANEQYKNVAQVPYALNDGNIFRKYCLSTLGVPEKNVKYLANATGNDIKTTINWLQSVTEVFDNPNVILYYAGHGIPDEASKSAYLLPIDGNGSDISTGYKLDDLYATLGAMPADHITVFMDACFSGSKREEGMLAQARGVALKAKAGVPQGNMVVFSAATGDETAYPNKEQGHGMFTYYLLKKLQETKGDVSLQELGEYITKNVRQQSIVLNGKSQTPTVTAATGVAGEWGNWKLK